MMEKKNKKSNQSDQSDQPEVDWQNVAKRAMADLDNYKKQAEKDKFEMLNIMKASSLVKFMEVYDDLVRSLEYVEDVKTKAGLEGVQNKFKNMLLSEGLEQIVFETGEEFNPEFAEAISYEDSDVGEGKVIETVEVGLKYKDRVIKPAKVRVAK